MPPTKNLSYNFLKILPSLCDSLPVPKAVLYQGHQTLLDLVFLSLIISPLFLDLLAVSAPTYL